MCGISETGSRADTQRVIRDLRVVFVRDEFSGVPVVGHTKVIENATS